MLHRINPVCTDQFTWVADLQRKLLEAVCTNGVTAALVTPDWLYTKLINVDKQWFDRFLQQKDKVRGNGKGLTILENLQRIAGASTQNKQLILAIYQNNREIDTLYQDMPVNRIRKITETGSDSGAKALQITYRAFMSSFYDPVFYDGYPATLGNSTEFFNRETLVARFKKDNDIRVCVLCDMDLNDPDVDHFFSKKEFPELACHPANLVPICKSCNGRARKGEKAPLDFDEPQQCSNWFHPYYRQVDWDDVNITFLQPDGSLHPTLSSNTADTQQRLGKLDFLIDLQERWNANWDHIFRTTVTQLRKPRAGRDLTNRVHEMAEDWFEELGHSSSAILRSTFLRTVAAGEQNLLERIRDEVEMV